MARIGYARVSTTEQNLESQTDALTAANCDRVFSDKASGKHASRPGLVDALDYLRPGDSLVITRLSRLARSLRHLIELAEQLRERGIDLVVIHQHLDTTTPAGRLLFHLIAAVDEFNRELIVEGTHEGLAAARARGRKGGRRPVMSAEQVTAARRMLDAGDSTTAVAKIFGVHRATLYRHLDKDGAAK